MKQLLTALVLAALCLRAAAQPALDAHHLLLDGSLSDAEVAARQHTYNTFQEAARHFSDSTTLYIAPYVYWIDNPDTPAVVVGNGGGPFGMVVRAPKLRLIGLDADARNTVLASQRGQTQGAVGNFTMFDFHVDDLYVENLTMGNYCNVDLDYPLNPSLSRKKRSEAITQAHVGYVRGRQLVARNVRFISRLNLNPLNGARHSYYEDCHFECTDDALNGRATYRHCTFGLYGQKPFWSTSGAGALFIDCDFFVHSNNREMYFCKQGGPVTVVDCRYHAPQDVYIGWTAYPQPWLRCYQQNFTLNGRPYTIGSRQPQNTVVMQGFEGLEPPYLAVTPRDASLRTAADQPLMLRVQSSGGQPVSWSVPAECQSLVSLSAFKGDSVVVVPTNQTDDDAAVTLVATTPDGRQAACHLVVKPSLLPAPAFLRQPRIVVRQGVASLDYALDLQGRRDESDITWLRNGIPVSVSHDAPQRTYTLTEADAGCLLSARIVPRHQRSLDTETTEVAKRVKKAVKASTLATDFSDFPCQWQPQLLEGYWTVDGFKPADTHEFDWSFRRDRPMWEYGEGFNGAVGRGLLQAQRGARLMYTPLEKKYGPMTLTLCVDPTKTAGQGFGSATGQYMDVCLKFDTRTLTGYALRIIRTTKHAKAVDFYLVEYQNGVTRQLTEPVSSTCYRTGCTIALSYRDERLAADVTTTTPKPSDSTLPHEVHLSATVAPNSFGGIAIQHTGSCGESTTMLHRLQADWKF